MFKWLTNLVEDARIVFAYIGYERECKKQWVTEAERRYSTTQVEQEILRRMSEPLRHVASTFNASIRDLEAKRQNVARVVSEARDKLVIFERDYKSELDAAYAVLNETREELKACRQNLSSAYDDLNSAKRSLDSWYSRAEGNWFGNGGRKLPMHAFFGQDLSDRDRYKSQRDSAARTVGRYKSERSSIEHRLDSARASVQRIKDARQVMLNLIKSGFDKRIVINAISNGNADLQSIDAEIANFQHARTSYIHQAKDSLGVFALEQEILRLNLEKDAHIKAFDNEAMVVERKAIHRAEWLSGRDS